MVNLSFMTLNRFVEEKAAADADYRRQLQARGRILLSDGRALSDEALLAKLRTWNLDLDRDPFRARAQRFLSAQEMAEEAYQQAEPRITGMDQDWVWIAFTCLWERWLADRPSLEMIDDQMQQGYQAKARGDAPGACRLWLATWKSIHAILDARQMRSLQEFDARYPLTNFLFNWVQDLSLALDNAGVKDPAFWQERIALLETLLDRLDLDENLRKNCRSDLADTYDAVGMPDRADALYHQWLHEEPRWGWGWIRWSDLSYHTVQGRAQDPARAESILKQGLAIPGVQDRDEILDRLADLYRETGRAAEARALRAETQQLPRPPAASPVQAGEGSIPSRQSSRAGDRAVPWEGAKRFEPLFRGEPPKAPARKAIIGRNDPCPCGSGKKFKRCCGRRAAP